MQVVMTQKETGKIDKILNGNLWKTVLYLSIPLAIYEVFNFLYGFIDIWLISGLDTSFVSSVAFVNEIKLAVTSFGGAIATSGAVIVAKLYASKKITEARKYSGQALITAIMVTGTVIGIMIIFGKTILKLFGANEEILTNGLMYYYLQMMTVFFISINSVFIGLEKAKANTKNILVINLFVMTLKLTISFIWIKFYNGNLVSLAISTLVAQLILSLIALYILFDKKITLHISFKDLKPDLSYIKPLIILAAPIFTGKFLFNMGKVFINSIALLYHPYAIAALSICGQVFGVFAHTATVLHDSQISIVSQNLAVNQKTRAIKTFYISLIYALIIVIVGFITCYFMLDNILRLLGDFTEEQRFVIKTIYNFEQFSLIFSALITVCSGLFTGFKKTKIVFWINILRVIILRLPLIWLMSILLPLKPVWHIGFIMFFSNSITTIIYLIFTFKFIKTEKKFQ